MDGTASYFIQPGPFHSGPDETTWNPFFLYGYLSDSDFRGDDTNDGGRFDYILRSSGIKLPTAHNTAAIANGAFV